MEAVNITAEPLQRRKEEILLHGHCQQKSVASDPPHEKDALLSRKLQRQGDSLGMLRHGRRLRLRKEHYDLSMKIGEIVLFPEVRAAAESVVVSARRHLLPPPYQGRHGP